MIAYINLGENMHQSEIKLTKRLKIKRVDVNKVKEQQKKYWNVVRQRVVVVVTNSLLNVAILLSPR